MGLTLTLLLGVIVAFLELLTSFFNMELMLFFITVSFVGYAATLIIQDFRLYILTIISSLFLAGFISVMIISYPILIFQKYGILDLVMFSASRDILLLSFFAATALIVGGAAANILHTNP